MGITGSDVKWSNSKRVKSFFQINNVIGHKRTTDSPNPTLPITPIF